MTKREIYLSIKHASRKVNLCYKELAVQITLRTTDEATNDVTFDTISYKTAHQLVNDGSAHIISNSETKKYLSQATRAMLPHSSMSDRVGLNSKIKKIEQSKGSKLNWLETIEQYLSLSSSCTWNKSGIKL